MKILALETATMAGSAAIVQDEELIGEIRVNISTAHAERLMPSIEYLLKASRISIKDIDAFAVSIGPGSFTGLRIGLSTAKGFSYSTGKPIISVPTLDAFARTLPFCPHFICPMLDARKNEVYAGLYKWEIGICTKIVPETAINPADFLRQIKGPAVFIGEGARIYKKLIKDALGDAALFAPVSKMIPSASAVGEIALEKLKNGLIADPVSLTPFYLRKSEAEIKKDALPHSPDI
ncbi:MAG: tRNA (adenosine(37)-N6)-threonylcarbamoyltransferase complex dimerization subunit type 1 TsaB [Nitrospirae bacterium]|nr:tRNA (adenosine(37)-N6)-threonylcarbamoyltransferase complex dimerization subunit type 1 TsaB [Nitrospirota bacterium]